MSAVLIDHFLTRWRLLDRAGIDEIDALYTPDVRFVDPFVQLDGIDALKRYLRHSYDGVAQVEFDFEPPLLGEGEAAVRWRLSFSHPRLQGGAVIEVPGITHLQFADRVSQHTDYYDAGALLYENVPLIGGAVRLLKRRLQG